MKKILLSITLALTFVISNAQVIVNDNYNSLTIGNVGTDVTGATAGQGGYYTSGSANSNFIIAADAAPQGSVVNIVGSATATGNRFMWKDITTTWASRTSGNNVLNIEFDLFTGPSTTSKNTAGIYVFNSDASTVLAAFTLNFATKALSGLAYFDPNNGGVNPVDLYTFNLGASNAVISLTANTWVRLGLSYNTTTRQVAFRGPGFYTGVTGAIPPTGTTAPSEIDYVHLAGDTNTVSVTSKFDNLLANANATLSILSNSDFNVTTLNFSVSPNPANDFINISNTDNILVSGISITDLNGRVVKQNSYVNISDIQVNVSDLASGMYMMTITSDKGTFTKKIVKN